MAQAVASGIPFHDDNVSLKNCLFITVEDIENIYNSMQFVPDKHQDTEIEMNDTLTCISPKPPDTFTATRQPATDVRLDKGKKSVKKIKCRTCGKYSKTYRKAMKNIQRMYRKQSKTTK